METSVQKDFGQPQFTVSFPSLWNSSEQVPQVLLKNTNFRVQPSTSPQMYDEAKHLGLQLLDQESTSTQSIGQSHDSVGAVGRTDSQDQSFSSESGEYESCKKGIMPVFSLSPDNAANPSQAEYGHPLARAPYPYGDTYYGGLFTPYGHRAIIQTQVVPQMMGFTGVRVPLPLDLADDGPIYVNAKQYHGILRRRQSRAKLEAQHKLVKTRKPYLHESRHRHAVNRVRGSGGRFLSTKNLQHTNSSSATNTHVTSDSLPLHEKNGSLDLETYSGTGQAVASSTSFSAASGNGVFRQPDFCFSGISAHAVGGLPSGGRFSHGGNLQCASVTR